MDANLDTLATALYARIDDRLNAVPEPPDADRVVQRAATVQVTDNVGRDKA